MTPTPTTTDTVVTNAIIESASIGLDRDIFLCMWLQLDYGDGLHQGFGGYVIGGLPNAAAGRHHEQPNLAADFIVGCLRAADVDKVSQLAGKSIRVRRTDEGFGGDIIEIGHITKDDRWFNPKARFEELQKSWEAQSC